MPSNEISSGLLWVAEKFGFAGLVAVFLLWWGRQTITALVTQIQQMQDSHREDMQAFQKDLAALSREASLERSELTKAVTLAILAMSFAPKGVQEQAADIKAANESREARRRSA